MNKATSTILKILIPIAILVIGIMGAGTLVALKPEPEMVRPQPVPPLVRVMAVSSSDVQFNVKSQGTVAPRTVSQLVPEVSGRVVKVGPQFKEGGFFARGDLLLEIDPFDYQQQLVAAKAALADTKLMLAREEAEARVAREEWDALGKGDEADPLTLHEPQLERAHANVEAARARLAQAERNLERTVIRAPFAGRVLSQQVDLGQFLTAGMPVGRIHALDVAEVRLPINNSDLPFVELPLTYKDQVRPAVRLTMENGQQQQSWRGQIVRTEGEVDPRTRTIHAIAEVQDPYAPEQGLPLTMGRFVQADIEGVTRRNVFEIPREALWPDDRVLVIDENQQAWFRAVTVLRKDARTVVITEGIKSGETICLSRVEAVTDGMKVRTVDPDADSDQAERS